MMLLTWKDVWSRRLARHFLLNRMPASGLAGVVGQVCGIHAQVMPAAELSMGLRVAGVTQHDLRAALWEERILVKTFGIRGTVHLFPSTELPLWMAALRARSAFDVKRYQAMGLDPEQTTAIVEAIRDALDGTRLTLRHLGDRIVEHLGPWAGETTAPAWGGAWPRWRMALGEAALAGYLCYGPPEGNEVTFVRADQWTGNWHSANPEEALTEVFRRYLRAYGPATVRDFAQWFNIPLPAARGLAGRIEHELEEVDVEGYHSYVLAADADSPHETEPAEVAEQLPARLLPHFDCYVIGCHPRAQLLHAGWSGRVPPRTTPSQLPVLLLDGTVAGIWQQQKNKGRIDILVEPFDRLDTRQQHELENEARRIGEVLGVDASLSIGQVSIGPHL